MASAHFPYSINISYALHRRSAQRFQTQKQVSPASISMSIFVAVFFAPYTALSSFFNFYPVASQQIEVAYLKGCSYRLPIKVDKTSLSFGAFGAKLGIMYVHQWVNFSFGN